VDNQTVRGKVAFVTGAGSGLGEATARTFAGAGCLVALIDLDQEKLDRVCSDLERQGDKVIAVPADVSDQQAVESAVQTTIQRLGRLDVAINCAATDRVVSVNDMSVQQWDRIIGVNLRGPFLVAKSVFQIMERQGGGHIVNVSSTAGVRAWGNAAAYHASKWGLIGFSRGLGVEGRPANIRVTTVIPGGMRTGWFDAFPEQGIPMPDESKLQDPANVARTILFAVQLPPDSTMQEVMVTPMTETSWP
jgi:NAD(P)-dependent dehydrogenase (short-subunit alcohol dehydrogenase family)